MDFSKDNEKFSYKSGYQLGELFSYVLFFSMLFFINSKLPLKNNIQLNYGYYIAILIGVYIIYKLFKKTSKRIGG